MMLKKKNLKAPNERLVNCWFCNQDSYIEEERSNSWLCETCCQYNGFTSDGAYNTDVPGQFDVKDQRTDTVCEAGHFHSAPSVLCSACNTNQILYVRQLATFKSMSEDSYDEELESYKDYLADMYKLCPNCEARVKERVTEQDQLLHSKMSPAQREKLTDVGREHGHVSADSNTPKFSELRPPCVPTLMFIGCFLLALVHLIICLRLYAVTVVSGGRGPEEQHTSLFSDFMLWIVTTVPVQDVFAVQESVIYLGATACLGGLFSSGKYSLYPEDCIHLLLWLLTLITWVEWVSVSEGPALVLSILTATLALVACFRPRQSRHLSPLLFLRKNLNDLGISNEVPEDDEARQIESTTTEGQESNSSPSSIPNSSQPFEEVRQDLETFSIGLSKKSSSKSSIWSLPAVVAASLVPDLSTSGSGDSMASDHMAPDSTTGEHYTPLRPGSPRSVLSPSRLGFLTFDSSPGSRSPSPWDPIMENSNNRDVAPQGGKMPSILRPRSPFQNLSPSTLTMSEGHHQEHLHGNEQNKDKLAGHQGLWRRVQPSQPSSELHGCYSPHSPPAFDEGQFRTHEDQAPRSLHHATLLLPDSQRFKSIGAGSDFCGIDGSYQRVNTSAGTEPNCTENSAPDETKGVRRRSKRLAMAGKLPKPWPLRKSLSCNNAMDRENVEKARLASRLDRLQDSVPASPLSNKGSVRGPDRPEPQQNRTQQPQLGPMPPLEEERNNQFFQYRDGNGSKFSQPFKSSNGYDCDSIPGDRGLFSRNPDRKVNQTVYGNEYSDDEDMEVDEPCRNSNLNKLVSRFSHSGGGDMSLRWILLGTVIGASLTCNVFLVLQGWVQR